MVRDGDKDAATFLYKRYARRVSGLVKSQLGAKLSAITETDDIVQSVFKSVFRGMQSGNYEAPPGSTLWNLIAVIAMHKLSRKAAHHSAQCRDTDRQVSISELDGKEAISDRSSFDFFEICVRETIEMLREFDRNVLTLRIQGCEVDEIANTLNRSKRTVERSLQVSRERLSNLLLNEDEVDG